MRAIASPWLVAALSCLALPRVLVACGPGGGGGSGGGGGQAGFAGVSGAAGQGAQGGSAGEVGIGGSSADAGMAGSSTGGAAGFGAAPSDGGFDVAVEDANVGDGAGGGAPSVFCGDGIRDPVLEECDDGTGSSPPDSCSASCQVEDVLVVPGPGSDGGVPPKAVRRVGDGRHPVGGGAQGFGVALVDSSTSQPAIQMRAFDEKGVPKTLFTIANDSTSTASANPVVAALPSGKFAVAWTDLGGDGSGPGIALRTVDPVAQTLGTLVRVNTTTSLTQRDPDLIWTGTELIVAWVDESKIGTTFADTKWRKLDGTGALVGGEQTLAGTAAVEANVALAPFAGTWAAAWRSASGSSENVVARTGTNTWSIPLSAPGPADDRPALAELDASHLLLVFTEGGGAFSTSRLRGAILDLGSTSATPFDISPLVAPYSTDPSLGQSHPNVVSVGTRIFVAWRSEAVSGVADAEELWLKELSWGALTLDLSAIEIPLPRATAHRKDDQRHAALAGTPLFPEGAIASAWDDYGRVFGSIEGTPDVVAELIPVPIVRLVGDGGSGQ